LRRAIIEISKQSATEQDQQTKQLKLYDYIRGREFCRQVESICNTDASMSELQNKEEKDHQTLWKKRESLQKQQIHTIINIKSEIDAIMQGNSQMEVKILPPKSLTDVKDESDKDEKPTSSL
jgi:hypothetical protein